jgi:putative oxidoreductase
MAMKDLGLLSLRGVTGGLLVGHGSQKLFGSVDGPGPEGTAQFLEGLGLRPGRPWAALAGQAEFGGGVLTLTGFLNPLGPLATVGLMATAALTQHRGKPIWATLGGAELPLINMTAAATLNLTGLGALSLDRAFHVRLPRWVAPAGLAAVGAAVAFGLRRAEDVRQQEEATAEESKAEGTDQVVEHLATTTPLPADVRDPDDVLPADVRAASGSAIVSEPPDSTPEIGG